MQVITDAKELEKHTYIKTRNPAVFPKKERLGLAQRMMNEASDLVADLMEANDLLLTDPEERELRYRAQRSALRNCRKLIHHTQTGKVVRKVRAKSIDNMKRKIRKFRGLVDSGKMTLDSVVQSYASWTGHISHGNTYHLRQNMDAYFFSYFPELKPSPKGDNTHGPKTEQPRKQVEGQVRQPVRQPDRLDRGR